MGAPLEITRTDYTSAELRSLSGRCSDGAQVRRLLALALILDGYSRTEAAALGGMDRQTLCDWVHRYNDFGNHAAIQTLLRAWIRMLRLWASRSGHWTISAAMHSKLGINLWPMVTKPPAHQIGLISSKRARPPLIISPDDPAWANHALCNPAKRLLSSVGLDGKTGPQTTPALELAARQHATPIPEPCFASILTGHTIPNLCANGCTATCPAQLPKSSPKAAIRTQQSALVPSATKTQIGH
jgi:hypothetical protein